MTAVAYPIAGPARPRSCPADQPPAGTARRRPSAAQFRRRRAAAAAIAAVVLLGGVAVAGVSRGPSLRPSGPAPAGPVADAVAVAETSYVVRPGDTLWQIARAWQPTGDVRPLVQRLAARRGGMPLRAGERLVLAPG